MHKTQPKGRNSAQLEDLGIWQSQTGRVWGRVGVVPGVCLVRQSVLAVPDGGRVWNMDPPTDRVTTRPPGSSSRVKGGAQTALLQADLDLTEKQTHYIVRKKVTVTQIESIEKD